MHIIKFYTETGKQAQGRSIDLVQGMAIDTYQSHKAKEFIIDMFKRLPIKPDYAVYWLESEPDVKTEIYYDIESKAFVERGYN